MVSGFIRSQQYMFYFYFYPDNMFRSIDHHKVNRLQHNMHTHVRRASDTPEN